MSIFLTGDTHGDFTRFKSKAVKDLSLTKDDFMIICGDFGGVWSDTPEQKHWLDWLNERPFTTLFISGNHENFDLLDALPVERWNGGMVQRVRPGILHLLRGQRYEIGERTFFTMGGAGSRILRILKPNDPLLRVKSEWFSFRKAQFWIEHVNWFRQELPGESEYQTARKTLDECGWSVDYIITHCAPTSIQNMLDLREAQEKGSYLPNRLTDFLDELVKRARFQYWFLGHYHGDAVINDKYVILYEKMIRLD